MINIPNLSNSTPIILNYYGKNYTGVLIRKTNLKYSAYICKFSEENHHFNDYLGYYSFSCQSYTNEYEIEAKKDINFDSRRYLVLSYDNLKAKLKSKKIKLLTFVDMWKIKREGLL